MRKLCVKEKRITHLSGGLAQLFILANKYPVLGKEAEQTATVEQLINHNLLFVISVAKRYEHVGVELLDLIQEGRIGLIQAAKTFDPTLGFRFTSYAVNWIRRDIIKYIETKRDLIRQPDLLNRLSYKLENSHIQDEAVEETAERIGVSKGHLKNYINRKQIVSFDAVDRDGETYVDVAGDIFADSRTLTNDMRQVLDRAISKLPEREQTIIKMRFFTDSRNSLEDVAKAVGVTRERTRQIETIALKRLKTLLMSVR